MSKKYVVANFKMNKLDCDVASYMKTLLPLSVGSDVQIMLAVPSVSIKTAVELASNSDIVVAGQNLNENDFGSLTGEINAQMLKGVGAGAVIVGHSERRTHFNETDEVVNRKILSALKNGMVSILCVGETIFDKTNGITEKAITSQITKDLQSVYANELGHIIVAYEPVWAIGTGNVPTKDEISSAISSIRKALANMYDEQIANKMAILYGGSVSDKNAKEIAKIAGVDGVLVGGASLVEEKFGKIIKAFEGKLKK